MSKSTGEFEVVEGNIVPVIVNDVVTGAEANECADNYMDTLRMERCEGEVPVYRVMPMEEPEMTEVDIGDEFFDGLLTETADTIITLPECDGMTDEFLFLQPSHGEYLEELTKELM